jgi:hypothetical protein
MNLKDHILVGDVQFKTVARFKVCVRENWTEGLVRGLEGL